MQKLIIDTNVMVSALIQKSFPFFIVQMVLDKKAELCISGPMMREYLEVLSRPKFSKFPEFQRNAELLIIRIQSFCQYFETDATLDIISDEADNRLLELAQVSKADYLITGNTKDFTMSRYQDTRTLTPREYWEEYMPGSL